MRGFAAGGIGRLAGGRAQEVVLMTSTRPSSESRYDPPTRPVQFMLQSHLTFAPPSPTRPEGSHVVVSPMASLTQGGAQVICGVQPMQGSFPVLIPQLMFRGRNALTLHGTVFPWRAANPMLPTGLQSLELEWRGRGRDCVVDLASSLHARKGDEHSLAYFQGLSRTLALGGKMVLKSDGGFGTGTKHALLYGLHGSYMTEDGTRTVIARWDTSAEDLLMLRFHRDVDERSQVAADFVVHDDGTSRVQLAAEIPLRYEDYVSGPYTSLRAALDSDRVLRVGVEHTIGAGSDGIGRVELAATLDHFRRSYRFGASVTLQS